MERQAPPDPSTWLIVRFPNRDQRAEFMTQVRFWNRLEQLPRIETASLTDGLCVRLWCADPRQKNIRRLIDVFGGAVYSRGARGSVPESLAS